ncbi:MAG: hypothetical protein ACI8ZB_005030 [Desulforhopalus sp.]|jgi:hypothetical protein
MEKVHNIVLFMDTFSSISRINHTNVENHVQLLHFPVSFSIQSITITDVMEKKSKSTPNPQFKLMDQVPS